MLNIGKNPNSSEIRTWKKKSVSIKIKIWKIIIERTTEIGIVGVLENWESKSVNFVISELFRKEKCINSIMYIRKCFLL